MDVKSEVESASEIFVKDEEDTESFKFHSQVGVKYISENVEIGQTGEKNFEFVDNPRDDSDFDPKKQNKKKWNPPHEKRFECDACNFKSRFGSNLLKHKRTVHDGIKGVCNFCKKEFTYLKEHIDAMHRKNKLYICKECNFSCVRLCGLRSHVKRRHTQTRVKQTCSICFIKCFNIEIHVQKMHENPAPQEEEFLCTSCPYKGKNKSNLYSHIKMVHEATYTFCQVCNKEVHAWKITSHMKKHQENQFSCIPCSKTFRVIRDLARHVMYYHKKHRNKCGHCGKEVTSLKQHIRFLHKEDTNPVDESHDLNMIKVIKAFLGENISYNGELDILTGENEVETNNTWQEDVVEEDPLAEQKSNDTADQVTQDGFNQNDALWDSHKEFCENQSRSKDPSESSSNSLPIVLLETFDE